MAAEEKRNMRNPITRMPRGNGCHKHSARNETRREGAGHSGSDRQRQLLEKEEISVKRHSCMQIFSIGVFLAGTALQLPAQQGQMASHTDIAYELRYVVQSREADLLFGEFEGYDVVTLRGAGSTLDVGKPVLPFQTIRFAIPPGMEAVDVRARALNSLEIPGSFQLMPSQPPARTSQKNPRERIQPDDRIYRSALPYPGTLATLDHEADLAGQAIAWVSVYPLRYLPARKKIVLHDLIEVTLLCKAGGTKSTVPGERYHLFTEKQRAGYEETIRTLVVNPHDVVLDPPMAGRSPVLPLGIYEHVVITSIAYASSFSPLVDWHTQKGLRDTVVTTGWIYENYEGPGSELKIRQFVIDASSNWGTLYFLMGGETSVVPFGYRTYQGESTPSDQYYSDYDDDWAHEVYVGRASIQSTGQVDTFVDKVLTYEKNPPLTDYPLNVLLIGMDLDSSTPCEDLKETIAGYIAPEFNVTKTYDSDATNHRTETINALNTGANLVNHADHSSSSVMGLGSVHHGWYLSQSDVDALVNDDKLSIVISTGCWPNAMDTEESISERFVIYNAGQAGVAFTGNTRSGWYSPGAPESLSGQLDREWWEGVFQYGQGDLGHALVWSKHNFPQAMNVMKHCEWTFNLLGEPAMPIWLEVPRDLSVSHPDSIFTGRRDFRVLVQDESGPIEGALVCLMKEGDVYEVGTTDSDGEVVLTVRSSSSGALTVTVTAGNHLPYEGTSWVSQNRSLVPVAW